MERLEGPPPIGILRKVMLASGVFLFVILSILIFTIDPSRNQDFLFLGLSYMIWTPMIVGLGRRPPSQAARRWLHLVPGAAAGLLLLVYLSETFQLQPNTLSIIISIGSAVTSILVRLASSRLTSGFLLANNLFLASGFLSLLFPMLYLSHLSVYHDPVDPSLIILSTGLVGLAPVYAILSESMFLRGRRAETRPEGRRAG